MSRRRTRPHAASPRWLRVALWSGGALLAALLLAVVVGKLWIESYLRSERFRAMLDGKIGGALHAESELSPLRFTGLSVYSDGLRARGGVDAKFSTIEADQVRSELSLRRFFEGVWQVERIEVQAARLDLGAARVTMPVVENIAAPASGGGGGWLPRRVEVAAASVRSLDLAWPGGALRGAALEATPRDGGWSLALAGGTATHADWPALELRTADLRVRDGAVFVQQAELKNGAAGVVVVSGEATAERFDLRAQLANVEVAPLLPPDWRYRLRGRLGGDATIRGATGALAVAGKAQLSDGTIEALPVLEELAKYTGQLQFKRLPLTRASADFEHTEKALTMKNLVLESAGLIRIEGAVTIAGGQIDGALRVGVAPGSLRFVPGAQERVFVEARDGYVWTPLRLTGSAKAPREDLTDRLIAAAAGQAIDTAVQTTRSVIETGKAVGKGLLDSIFK